MNITFKTAESVSVKGILTSCVIKLLMQSSMHICTRTRVLMLLWEVMAVGHCIIVAGEISSSAKVNIPSVVWRVLDKGRHGFLLALRSGLCAKAEPDIAGGVNYSLESRNGDDSWYSSLLAPVIKVQSMAMPSAKADPVALLWIPSGPAKY